MTMKHKKEHSADQKTEKEDLNIPVLKRTNGAKACKRKTNLFRDKEEHRLFVFAADFSVLNVFLLFFFFLLVDPTLIIVDVTFFLTKNEA